MNHEPALWDLPTRLLHWLVAGGILCNFFILEPGDPAHRWVGYGVTCVVLGRWVWGFFGNRAARFSSWPLSRPELRAFTKNLFAASHPDYPGHNPGGALAYFMIWLTIAALALSGWMMGLDRFWGEEWLENVHAACSRLLQFLVVMHLLGLAHDSLRFRRHTWLGMITGYRRKPTNIAKIK